ncbi:FAD-binding domain-containing protein [Parathielavia hyrcaniae]|uniref:FAD-binding domain-containing protein n=1 Tax=Parathielavia hyrcaniae TaxID=113614 RepID=A0AAN6SZH4_9PEZI|nr:FAD-binding domain-containing protein [Parathielavia hyrcaniae]
MKGGVVVWLCAALLLAQDAVAKGPAASAAGDESSGWVLRREGSSSYACKCYPGDSCWPNHAKWRKLNATVGGNLKVNIPPGAPCYNSFEGPLGEVNTYDEAECDRVTSNWHNEQFQIELPAASLWTYFTNDTCRPTTNPSDTCTLGYYPVLAIIAKTAGHIQAGINFARENNLRLVVRNTGHDFLGRSVGWGALVINTHNFQDIKFTGQHRSACSYRGSAVTVGAGVQAFEVLTQANALSPPKIMVTGECATVGVAGGLVQGGGHGPLTNFYGFLADTALQFKVITADGVLRTANAKTNPELFWALRGGGPAAFGVIVEATYKTFDDKLSSGVHLDIDTSHTTNATLFWEAVRIFHGYSTHFVDNGLYVYYELGTTGQNLHVHPFVGIGKTPAELQAVLQPMWDDFAELGITYTTSSANYSTFYDLFNAMFETEMAGNSALTGGWSIGRRDVEDSHPAIMDAFQTIVGAGSFMIGHMWSAGHGLPRSEWGSSAVNPRFRTVVDKLITVVPLAGNAPLADKAAAQDKLTNVVDAALRNAAPNGCAYINEADPYEPNWQHAFWGTNYPALLRIRQKYDPNGVFYAVSTPGTEKWEQIETGTRLCRKL